MLTARVGIVLCKCNDRGFARFLDAADQPGDVFELQLRRRLKGESLWP